MKIKHFMLILNVLACFNLMAQKITVSDASTLQAIQGVKITDLEQNIILFTDPKGQIDLTSVQKSKVILIEHSWYYPITVSLDDLKAMGYQVSLQERINSYDEIVVSASKFEEKRKDVAQPIRVIRTNELEQMNQSTTADALQSSGSVFVQKSQLGGGSPIIRGFETNKVLMVVDGVRMNNAIYRGGHLQNVITLDNAVMEKIEVVYGPGSVVYGSDALGGVMHFYTKNPSLTTDDKTLVKGGAYTRYMSALSGYSANGTVSLGGKRFGSLTAFTYNKFGDLRQGSKRLAAYPTFGSRPWYVERINGIDSMVVNADSNLQVGSGYEQYDFMQKFLFKSSEFVQHCLNFQYSTSSNINRYDRLTQMAGGLARFGAWYYGPQKRLMASYTMQMTDKNTLYDHARIIFAYQEIEESRHDRRYRKDIINRRIENLNIFSFNADFEKKIGKNELRYGLEAWYNQVRSVATQDNIVLDTSASQSTRYPDAGSEMKSAALYFTHTWEINPKLILNDGLRFNAVGLNARFVDQTFFPFPFSSITQKHQALNGNLGLVYMPTESWRFNAIVSSGFRAPNVDDLSKVFESAPGTLVVPNPDIKPEYTWNGELGISKTFVKKLNISAVAYYTLYKNAIATLPFTYNGQDSVMYDGALSAVVASQNATEAYLYGVEANLAYDVNKQLLLTSSLCYTYGRFKTDSLPYPMDHIPPMYGRAGISYKLKKFKAEFFAQYSAWKKRADYNMISGEDNLPYATVDGMPSWYTLNLRLSYQFNKWIGMQVACENILDRNYRTFSSNISAPGRNFIVTLRGSF